MAKKPEKVPENVSTERVVWISGWAYNFMIDRAVRQRRDVKAELSIVLEQAIRDLMAAEGKEPGNSLEQRKVA